MELINPRCIKLISLLYVREDEWLGLCQTDKKSRDLALIRGGGYCLMNDDSTRDRSKSWFVGKTIKKE